MVRTGRSLAAAKAIVVPSVPPPPPSPFDIFLRCCKCFEQRQQQPRTTKRRNTDNNSEWYYDKEAGGYLRSPSPQKIVGSPLSPGQLRSPRSLQQPQPPPTLKQQTPPQSPRTPLNEVVAARKQPVARPTAAAEAAASASSARGGGGGRGGGKKPRSKVGAPLTYDELKRARDAGALQRLLTSSEAEMAKFELQRAALERQLQAAVERAAGFSGQLARAGNAASEVKRMLKNAQTVSEHSTSDMRDAVDAAVGAIGALRTAHESLTTRLAEEGVSGPEAAEKRGATSPTHQMPQHPNERPTLARQITNVREGVEACRKHLKAAEGIFSRSRAEIQAAANGVSAAVKLSRKS